MRNTGVFTVLGALVAAAVSASIAVAAPASAETAQETIARLQSQGYTVRLDKIGTGPVDTCTVTSVRNPQTVSQLVPLVGPVLGQQNGNALIPVVTSKTVSVSLVCDN